MFGELVSGRKKNRTRRQKADSHISSKIVHVQGLWFPTGKEPDSTANPPIRGPSTGPQTAPMPQTARP
jgi:hypothetical protein